MPSLQKHETIRGTTQQGALVNLDASPRGRSPIAARRPWYGVLYTQVLIAIALGVLAGYVFPITGTALKPLGDAFIQLIRMMIAPVIFCTVVHGIASMQDLAKVGLKALIYFEVVSTVALGIGLLVSEIAHPVEFGELLEAEPA